MPLLLIAVARDRDESSMDPWLSFTVFSHSKFLAESRCRDKRREHGPGFEWLSSTLSSLLPCPGQTPATLLQGPRHSCSPSGTPECPAWSLRTLATQRGFASARFLADPGEHEA